MTPRVIHDINRFVGDVLLPVVISFTLGFATAYLVCLR